LIGSGGKLRRGGSWSETSGGPEFGDPASCPFAIEQIAAAAIKRIKWSSFRIERSMLSLLVDCAAGFLAGNAVPMIWCERENFVNPNLGRTGLEAL
jgi:hypothetical protein